jgi:hypothetical protein
MTLPRKTAVRKAIGHLEGKEVHVSKLKEAFLTMYPDFTGKALDLQNMFADFAWERNLTTNQLEPTGYKGQSGRTCLLERTGKNYYYKVLSVAACDQAEKVWQNTVNSTGTKIQRVDDFQKHLEELEWLNNETRKILEVLRATSNSKVA